jgi:hypothetical protein
MTDRDAKFTGRSYSLLHTDGAGDTTEADLLVHFNGTKGVDYHPYGSTYAAAPWAEIGEVEEYILDDMPVTLQYLYDTFGKENVDKAVQEAEDGADEDYE